MTRLVFLDTETTGLSHESGDRIIEIGCVEMVNRRLTGRTKHFYVNPQRTNSNDALKVHGLTDEFLADKPLFGAVADELIEFLAGAEVIAHNAPFDVGFLEAELQRLDKPTFVSCVGSVTDSLALARESSPAKPIRSTHCAGAWRSTTPTARCTARCSMPDCWPRCTSA